MHLSVVPFAVGSNRMNITKIIFLIQLRHNLHYKIANVNVALFGADDTDANGDHVERHQE